MRWQSGALLFVSLLLVGCPMEKKARSKAEIFESIKSHLGQEKGVFSDNTCADVYKSDTRGGCYFSTLPPEETALLLQKTLIDSELKPASILRQDYSIYTQSFKEDNSQIAVVMRAYTIEDASPVNERKVYWPWKEKGYKTRLTIETFDN